MNITISGHQIEVTSTLRQFVTDKFKKLEEHSSKIMSIHVVLKVEKLEQIAEATVIVSKHELHASAKATNMYPAIEELVHKLDKQLMTYKGKQLDHRNHDNLQAHLDKEQEEE